ncbi:hypothetical protein AB0I77_29260 [Streptomyces sp. NPDC050619]|uniref:hypothetical protein n=1 Tax=Streptomyces sp. NPDC050619 TaxID=3157214 RepID=UPI00344955A5
MATTPFLAVMVLFAAGPAHAADRACLRNSDTDLVEIAPKAADWDQQARSVTRQSARDVWYDVIWRGKKYVCSDDSPGNCQATWSESKNTTFGWSVGSVAQLGNASSKDSKKWYNFIFALIPNVGKTTTMSSTFSIQTPLRPGDVAEPQQVVKRRWTQGDYVGGWIKENEGCIYGLNQSGNWYHWDPNVRFGNWETNVREEELSGIAINGVLKKS